MAASTTKMKIKRDGKEWPYLRVSYYDEKDKRRHKTFRDDAKGRSKAKAFVETIDDVVKATKTSIKEKRPLAAVVQDMAKLGMVNSFVKTLQQAQELPQARVEKKPNEDKTVSELVDEFVSACEIGRDGRKPLKRTSVDSYRTRLEPLKNNVGDRLPATITKQDMREYRDKVMTLYGTRRSAKSVFSTASIFFDYLVDEIEVIDKNPAKGVRFDLSDDEETKSVTSDEIYTDAEIERLLTAALDYTTQKSHRKVDKDAAYRDRAILVLLVRCGMRIGEVLARLREDIDLGARIINVTTTLSKWREVTTVKTMAGRRQVIIPTSAVASLQDWLARTNNKHAFHTETGEVMFYRNFFRSWERLVKKAEVPYRNIHSLRHYYVSKLIDAGYDEDRITRMIGHEDINFTKKVYGHLLDRRTRLTKDAEDIDRVF